MGGAGEGEPWSSTGSARPLDWCQAASSPTPVLVPPPTRVNGEQRAYVPEFVGVAISPHLNIVFRSKERKFVYITPYQLHPTERNFVSGIVIGEAFTACLSSMHMKDSYFHFLLRFHPAIPLLAALNWKWIVNCK